MDPDDLPSIAGVKVAISTGILWRFEMEMWKLLSACIGGVIAMFALIWFIMYQLTKDITMDGIAESLGKTVTEFERAYDRGREPEQ